ncbi:hypothetical protein [Bradyrhizobium sp. UFLA05-112]
MFAPSSRKNRKEFNPQFAAGMVGNGFRQPRGIATVGFACVDRKGAPVLQFFRFLCIAISCFAVSVVSVEGRSKGKSNRTGCNFVDLEVQTDCLIAETLQRRDLAALQRYLNLPYANPKRLMVSPTCRKRSYFDCALVYGVIEAFPAISAAGGDPNIHDVSQPTLLRYLVGRLRELNKTAQLESAVDILIASGLNANTVETSARFTPSTTLAAVITSCQSYDRAMFARVLQKLVTRAGAQPFARSARGGMSIPHQVATSYACVPDALDAIGFASMSKAGLQLLGLYTDDFGASIVDVAMSSIDRRRRPPYDRMCLIANESLVNWALARYFASKDQAIATDMAVNQGRLGTYIECAWGRIFAGVL